MIEKLLNLLFNKVDIINYRVKEEGELYLRRWFIYPRKPADLAMVPRLYLHKFYTGDNDRHPHDHPWKFRSLILKGGYWEHSFNPEWLKWKALEKENEGLIEKVRETGVYSLTSNEWGRACWLPLVLATWDQFTPQFVKKWYGPGSILKRGAAWTHSVELKTDEQGKVKHAWSLVWTGIKCRSWGFHTENGWCWWRFYKQGACVCYDNPNEKLER